MAPLPAAVLAAIIGSAGSLAGGVAKAGAIAQQNAYNHPARQLARLRKAGLPFAAMSAGGAPTGNASGDFGDLGLTETGGRLSQFLTNQQTQEAINLAKIQQDKDRADADIRMGERDFLLKGYGPDGKTANINTNLRALQGSLLADEKGKQIANRIQNMVADNTAFRLNAENRKIEGEIANLAANNRLTLAEAGIAEIKEAFQKGVSEAELEGILLRNGFTKEQIESENIRQDLMRIQRYVEDHVKESRIKSADYDAIMKAVQSDALKREFKNASDYQVFVDRFRNYLNNENTGNWESIKAYMALLYTSITGLTGESPNLGRIIGGIGSGSNYYYHNNYLQND